MKTNFYSVDPIDFFKETKNETFLVMGTPGTGKAYHPLKTGEEPSPGSKEPEETLKEPQE